MIYNMDNEEIVAEKDMNILGIHISKGTRIKRLNDFSITLSKVVEIGYYDSLDVINEIKNNNKEI